MINLSEVVKSMSEYKAISKTTLYRYIIELLETLKNEELFILAFSDDVPGFVRSKAYIILMKRVEEIRKDCLNHDNRVNNK